VLEGIVARLQLQRGFLMLSSMTAVCAALTGLIPNQRPEPAQREGPCNAHGQLSRRRQPTVQSARTILAFCPRHAEPPLPRRGGPSSNKTLALS
jgi:hypothetical protein